MNEFSRKAVNLLMAWVALPSRWRCWTGRHRLGTLFAVRLSGAGWPVYDCPDCGREVRLRATWAAIPTGFHARLDQARADLARVEIERHKAGAGVLDARRRFLRDVRERAIARNEAARREVPYVH